MTKHKTKLIVAAIAALAAEVVSPVLSGHALASPPQFTQAFIRLDRLKQNTPTGGTICATVPTTTTTAATVVVNFPATYTVVGTPANWTTSVTNMPTYGGTLATAWPSIQANATSATTPANVVTWTTGNLTAATPYCFNFSAVNTLTTAAAAANNQQAQLTVEDGGSAALYQTNIALANITDDQIVVSAVVPPTFIFALSGNTDTFPGNLDPATVMHTAGRTASVTTNAKGGWIGWVKDSQQGLFSATANYTIATAGVVDGVPSTLVTNSEGYVLDSILTTDAAGGCTVAVDPEYNGGLATSASGGTLSANFQPYAACTGAPPATSNGDVITLVEKASIAGGTPAGSDYTDIITVVAAGNF